MIQIYEREVISFPTEKKRLNAINDPTCAIYMGNKNIAHNKRTLFITFRQNGTNGQIDKLYRIKFSAIVNLQDQLSLEALQQSYCNDLLDRIKKYNQITNDNFKGDVELYVLDLEHSISLPIPAKYEHNAPQNRVYHDLTDFFNNYNKAQNVVYIPFKNQ